MIFVGLQNGDIFLIFHKIPIPRARSIHVLLTGYRILLSIIPDETELIRQMMYDLGVDPDDYREDDHTPIGIGNLCGNNVVRDRLDDGINQVMSLTNRKCKSMSTLISARRCQWTQLQPEPLFRLHPLQARQYCLRCKPIFRY